MIGATISHYKITEKLGEGGMGVVYKAQDTKLDRPVALKFLAPHLLRDEEGRKRFEREARAAAKLDHPNICTVYEIDEVDGRTFIVMAFLEGRPLSERIKEGPLKLTEALSIAIQMAEGLEAAHEKGITHRDIKPDNVMLMAGSRGLVKLMDFGLAQLAGSSKFTREGTTLGTVNYMSPEQAEGAPTGHATDIWSLGVVLHEMVAGQKPFRGDFDQAIVYSIMNEPAEPLTALRTGVPKELERIANKCLAKKPDQRYHHTDELLGDLQAVRQELEPQASRMAMKPAAAKRGSPALIGAGAVVLLGVLGLGWWFGHSSEPRVEGPPPTSVPFTSYRGIESDPVFSPNGEDVAFAWNGEQQDNSDIYVKRLGTQSPLRLTTHSDGDFSPTWSPDGREIAFVRWSADHREVIVVPSLGGPERKLADLVVLLSGDGSTPRTGLAWSPDGKFLAVAQGVSAKEPSGIFLLSIDTREKQRLTSAPGGWFDLSPAFSPDGRHLAFARFSTAWVADIHVVPLDDDATPSGDVRRLTNDQRDIQGLDWTADGRGIVFSSNRMGGQRLWRIPVSGGEPEPLGVAGESASLPSVSRNGNRLVYVRKAYDRDIWRTMGPFATERDPAVGPRPLIASTREDYSPNYSPDGKRIVFDSNRSGTEEIWVCDSDGTNPVQLTSFGGPPVGVPRWSPDGEWIAFDSRKEGDADIYVIRASGGPSRRLTLDPGYDARPSWSQDGRWVYFVSRRSGDFQIWKIPAEGGEAVPVSRNGGRQAFEYAEGRFVYYVKSGVDGVWKMPVEGGEEAKVLDQGSVGRWALLNEGICFLDFPSHSIQFFNFATGRTEPVVILPEDLRIYRDSFAVSPDGQWVLFAQEDENEADIMLVENFR
ncbi:MAG TPA: protein kinase [Bryobacterales bacterium]|nr:protein kinase [Bryobacterales bacterium]